MAYLRKKFQLLRGLIDGEIAYTGPFYAEVNPTNLCNVRCLGCRYQSSTKKGVSRSATGIKHMSLNLVEQLCEELPRLGTREVIICGEGESLLHPHWFDMVSSFKRAGFHVQLYTNGTLLNEFSAALVLDSRLDVLMVSLWASSPEEYARCYPGVEPENFRRTLRGIELVSGLKARRQTQSPTVILTGPLNRYNYGSIVGRISLAHEVGCDGVRFAPYIDWAGESTAASLSLGEIETVCEDLAQSEKLLKSLSLRHNLDEILLRYRLGEEGWLDLPCYAGWYFAHIRFDGTVRPCASCPITLGDLNESSFEDIWNGPDYRAFRARAMRTGALPSLAYKCDCRWCCYGKDNHRVHRYFRWIAPLLKRTE